MIGLNKTYNMDCLEGMKLIPDGSIDLVVTDPPYLIEISGGVFTNNLINNMLKS